MVSLRSLQYRLCSLCFCYNRHCIIITQGDKSGHISSDSVFQGKIVLHSWISKIDSNRHLLKHEDCCDGKYAAEKDRLIADRPNEDK